MLSPWLDDPVAEETVAAWSDAVGLDLRRLGTTAEADEIKDTAVTQPLVVATALLAAARLGAHVTLPERAPIAGHSVGELAAAAVAGVLPTDAAVALAAVRGREMAAACALEPTGMSALLGGNPDDVLARLSELGLEPANMNGAGQIVAAGPLSALAALAENPRLLDPVRRVVAREWQVLKTQSEDPDAALVAWLAAQGLSALDMHELSPLDDADRERIRTVLFRLLEKGIAP